VGVGNEDARRVRPGEVVAEVVASGEV